MASSYRVAPLQLHPARGQVGRGTGREKSVPSVVRGRRTKKPAGEGAIRAGQGVGVLGGMNP